MSATPNNIQSHTPQDNRFATSFANQFPLASQLIASQFQVDWHLVALPLIQAQSETDPLYIFKNWLSRMIILAPIPSLMTGESSGETLEPERNGSNFGEWFSGLLRRYPAAYTQIDRYLREVMPDIQDIQNEPIGKDAKSMVVQFEANNQTLSLDFKDLSDGEKCFFLCAVVLAANKYYSPFCFWDEPDNYLSLSEVGHFITTLRRSFKNSGQILVTAIQIERPSGGWGKVVDNFTRNHVSEMRKYQKRMIVLLIDFDDNKPDRLSYENRLNYIKSQIPNDLQDRVFILGSRTSPEKLRSDIKLSFEEIGEALAEDCPKDKSEIWEHHLLKHNEDKLKLIRKAVKSFLFNV